MIQKENKKFRKMFIVTEYAALNILGRFQKYSEMYFFLNSE